MRCSLFPTQACLCGWGKDEGFSDPIVFVGGLVRWPIQALGWIEWGDNHHRLASSESSGFGPQDNSWSSWITLFAMLTFLLPHTSKLVWAIRGHLALAYI